MTKGTFTRGSRKQARNRSDQEGSILIAASVFLLVGVILLGAIQIGYMYYTKRELQKTADLAALTGVQSLWQGTGAAQTAAEKAAAQNFSGATVVSTPGNWANGKFDPSLTPTNALQVDVSAPASPIVPFANTGFISAHAQAITDPVAEFSVGSRLLNFNPNGVLGQLLKPLGVSDTDLNVLDSTGVAKIGIRPIDLLKDPRLHIPLSVFSEALSPDALAQDTMVQLGSLLDIAGDIIGQTPSAEAIPGLSDALSHLLGALGPNTSVPLFGKGGILSIVQGVDPSSALSTKVSALDFIAATSLAASIANGKNSAGLKVGVPGIADINATIVQPPSLAIGGVGTLATNSQIQLSLVLGGSVDIPLLGSLLSLNVPIHIDVATSQGELKRLCEPDLGNDKASILIQTSAASVCLASAQGYGDCASQGNSPVELVNVAGLVKATSYANSPLAASDPTMHDFTVGSLETINSPDINLLVSALVVQVVSHLKVQLLGGVLNVGLGAVTFSISGALQSLLEPLGADLQQVLTLLGLNLSQTDVQLRSIQCASPRLVQ